MEKSEDEEQNFTVIKKQLVESITHTLRGVRKINRHINQKVDVKCINIEITFVNLQLTRYIILYYL